MRRHLPKHGYRGHGLRDVNYPVANPYRIAATGLAPIVTARLVLDEFRRDSAIRAGIAAASRAEGLWSPNRPRWAPLPGDRRTWPQRASYAAAGVLRSQHTLRVPKAALSKAYLTSQVGFVEPKQVALCIRRKRRKAVMHALGHAGKRGRKGSYRRNWFSEVTC